MKTDLTGKVALVTGGATGIGRATAQLFAKRGAKVAIADIRADKGEETAQSIREAGGEAAFFEADVADADAVTAMVAGVVREFGRLDCACNNAGIGGTHAPTAEYPEDVWRRVLDVNLTGIWLCLRAEIPAMLKTGGGAIVNMSSIFGRVGFPQLGAYVAAKHGVIGLTKTAALEYATQGIRVNAVCAGLVKTPLLLAAGIADGGDMESTVQHLHPVRRFGTTHEIAEVIVWLCSDAASFVTGESVLADGGYVAQ